MNFLLTYFIDNNSIPEWRDKFSSGAQNVIMYRFKGTNGRYLSSFDNKFSKFKEVEGLDRSEWPVAPTTGQEIHKQYTIPMLETRLFYRENEKYYMTAKGKVFEKYLALDLNEDEKWFVNYILLMDSTIGNREKYLLNRSIDIKNILVQNTSREFVDKATAELFIERNTITDPKELAKYDYLYLNCFYLEPDFLNKFYNATPEERNELKEYVYNDWKERNNNDCVSKKFVSTNYSLPELIDDLKIYMFSNQINELKYTTFDDLINKLIDIYHSDYEVDKKVLYNFINENKDVFEPILLNVYSSEDVDDGSEDLDVEIIDIPRANVNITALADRREQRIDDTTIEGEKQLQRLYEQRKPVVLAQSDYKCELDSICGCKYFTSKRTGKNFLEVHHFIPKAFRNNFDYCIDILANYIALCPNCHERLHKAVDREREDLIRYIYNQRKERLKNCGIEIEYEKILNFYNFDSNN